MIAKRKLLLVVILVVTLLVLGTPVGAFADDGGLGVPEQGANNEEQSSQEQHLDSLPNEGNEFDGGSDNDDSKEASGAEGDNNADEENGMNESSSSDDGSGSHYNEEKKEEESVPSQNTNDAQQNNSFENPGMDFQGEMVESPIEKIPPMMKNNSPMLTTPPEPQLVLYEDAGKFYIRDENTGVNLKSQWVTIGDKKYYASDNEYLWQSRTINMDKKNYYVGDDCSVVMGEVVYDKNRDKYYYTDPSSGAYVKGQWIDYNGKRYYASDSEELHRSRTINMAGKNYYVGDDCSLVMGEIVYDKNRDKYYYTDSDTGVYVKGQWVDYNGKKYYASDAEALHRSRTINMAGKNYYVGDDCSVQYGVVYAKNNGNYYYADPSNGGAFVKGQWVDDNGKRYYASDSEPLHRNRTINMGGKNYYVGDDCSVQYGVVYAKNNGNYYYADPSNGGAFVKGQWVDHNGKKYYASDSEPLHRNRTINMDGKNYYVGDDCSVVMGKVVYDKNRDKYYYTDPSTGVYVKGQWVDYNGKKYYASDSEPLHRNRTINMDGKDYYVGDDCSVQKGLVSGKNGKAYYANPDTGVLETWQGFRVIDGKKYYMSSGNAISTGIFKVGDRFYFGDPNNKGAIAKGQWVNYGGKKYYASDNEYLHRNRIINMDKKDYYVGDDCSVQYGMIVANGKVYFADTNTGVISSSGNLPKSIKDSNATMIAISISNQSLAYYEKGTLILSASIVSGKPPTYSTPKGTHYVRTKSRNTRLTGPTWDVTVNYWMGISSNGYYGIHDATWRSSFGGGIYKYDGSHGCVNVPYSSMVTLFSRVKVGTLVYIY